jgi:RNA polymerase sigma-70 factor (ECF subfamily)
VDGNPRVRLVRSGPNEAGVGDADPLVHADGLYRLARHLCRTGADAEDLVQETYVRAFRALERADLPPGSDQRAWLFRILRNAFVDLERRARRSPIGPGDGDEAADGTTAPDDAWLRGDVELDRMRGLVAGEIEAALRALGEDARTLILLDLEGFSEAELGQAMGCARGTVKSRLSRARAALRERLAEYGRVER